MPRLLFLTCHLPYPLISGGRRREYELISRLSRRHEMHLVAVTKTLGEDLENSIVFDDLCASVTLLPAECTDDLSQPLQVRRHGCEKAKATVERIIGERAIDLVHVEAFYMLQHLSQTDVPVFLQEQNIEYLLWKQRAQNARAIEEKTENLWEYLRTLQAEKRAWHVADMCGAITMDDLETMALDLRPETIRLVPDGFDHLAAGSIATMRRRHRGTPVAVFVANFAYQPNVDAALNLMERIWPRVVHAVPDARLLLVGNAPPGEVKRTALRFPSIRVTGRVRDVRTYMQDADVVVCPLRVGGGIKVKVLEALSLGKAVVTTSVGAQGIPAPEEAMRIVDDPGGFARATIEVMRNPSSRARLERQALAKARQLPSWDEAAALLETAYESLLAAGTRRNVPSPPPGLSQSRLTDADVSRTA